MSEFVIVLVLIVASIGLVWLLYKANELQKKNIYVYPKTKNKYLVKGIVKMKDTKSNAWVDAILYIDLKNGQYYVLDKKEFMEICIILKDWKKDGRKIRKDKKRN